MQNLSRSEEQSSEASGPFSWTSRPSLPGDQRSPPLRHLFGREAEVGGQVFGRGGAAVALHADHVPFVADVLVPAEGGRGLDRQPPPDAGGQPLVAVLPRLLVEQLP